MYGGVGEPGELCVVLCDGRSSGLDEAGGCESARLISKAVADPNPVLHKYDLAC